MLIPYHRVVPFSGMFGITLPVAQLCGIIQYLPVCV